MRSGSARAGAFQATHLGFDQPAVGSIAPQQCIRRAVLHEPAPLHHQDAVEAAHRGQPVRDGDDGAAVHEAAERFADQLLRFAVERGGRLVEQQQRGVLQEGAGDGDALALPARQADAAISDQRVEPLRQLLDELAAAGRFRGLPDLVVVASGRA